MPCTTPVDEPEQTYLQMLGTVFKMYHSYMVNYLIQFYFACVKQSESGIKGYTYVLMPHLLKTHKRSLDAMDAATNGAASCARCTKIDATATSEVLLDWKCYIFWSYSFYSRGFAWFN
jgi:hypothetical protein